MVWRAELPPWPPRARGRAVASGQISVTVSRTYLKIV